MKKWLVLLIAVFFWTGPAAAADVNLLIDQAKGAYNTGKKMEAVEILKESVLAIWDDLPLTVKNVRLVTDTDTYATRPNDVYRSGEPIYMASQLLGYKMKKEGELYKIDIVTDFYVADEGGKVLGGAQEFGKFSISSYIPTIDFRLDLTYTLTDAPPGVYELQTVVHDQNSNKTTKFSKTIKIE